MLLHKVLAATEKEGKQQAALLLQDWLVILAASYDKLTHRHGQGQLHEQVMTVGLTEFLRLYAVAMFVLLGKTLF